MMSHSEPISPTGTADPEPPSRFSVSSRRRLRRCAVSGLTLILVIAAAALLISQYRRTLDLERTAMTREALTIIGAVEAGVNVHARHGAQYIEARLYEYLERLLDTSPALTILLASEDGAPFMVAGELELLTDPGEWTEARIDATWMPRNECARFHRTMPPPTEPRGPGIGRQPRGREHWVDLPEGPLRIAVALDAAELTERIASARMRLGVALAGLALLVVLTGVVYALWERRQTLEAQLWRMHEQAAEQERLAQLGAGLAHETRNPLGIVRGLMQSITGDNESTESVRRMAGEAIDEVDRTVGRINSFLQLARPVEPQRESVELNALFDDVTRLLRTEAPEGAVLEHHYSDSELTIWADSDMLRRALFNLGINAVHALDGPGTVRFEAKHGADGSVTIEVRDTGRGIAPEDLPHVTEPYFTRSANGSGLGLAIVNRIADAHGWELRITSEPGSGTKVSLAGLTPVS